MHFVAAGADVLHRRRDRLTRVVTGRHGGQGDQDRRVVGLRRVGELGQVRVEVGQPGLELVGRRDTRQGALDALEGALREVLVVVGQVAVDEVDLLGVGADALLDQLGDDLLGLVERDDRDGLRVGGLDLADLGREAGRLRVVDDGLDDLATTVGDRLGGAVGQAGAVGVLQRQDADRRVAVGQDQVTEDPALEDVRRGGAEVQTLVVVLGELVGGVGRRDLAATPAPTILSITESDTLDDAAPMMASTSLESRRSTDCDAVSVEVSPESESIFSTGLPLTPPASLMSLRARSTPANSGGPRNASEPVCGSSVPILSVPSPLAAAAPSSTRRPWARPWCRRRHHRMR